MAKWARNMQNRYFLAVEASDHVKINVKVLQEHVKVCEADVKLVEPENLHFTVKFLGNLDDKQVHEIIDALTTLLKGEKPSKVSVRGVGFFGKPSSPRVIWVGVGLGKDYIIGLFCRISAVLCELGIKTEENGQIPHITVGRMRSDKNINKLKEIISKESETFLGEVEINAVKLKSSVLTSNGPVYTDVHVFNLKTNA